MTELTRNQVQQIFNERFAGYLGSVEEETIHEVDPEIISWLRGPGSKIAEWHFKAFAEIDDSIRQQLCHDNKDAIEQVREKYSRIGHTHRYDSFESMYYEFKRSQELVFRRREFSEHLFAGNKEAALEHLYRLLLITDINSLFGNSE